MSDLLQFRKACSDQVTKLIQPFHKSRISGKAESKLLAITVQGDSQSKIATEHEAAIHLRYLMTGNILYVGRSKDVCKSKIVSRLLWSKTVVRDDEGRYACRQQRWIEAGPDTRNGR